MEKVFVFRDFDDAEKAMEMISLFKGCCMVPDEGWPLPAYKVKGEASAVRGFAAFCAARFDKFVALD
jgi:hypothetical protein